MNRPTLIPTEFKIKLILTNKGTMKLKGLKMEEAQTFIKIIGGKWKMRIMAQGNRMIYMEILEKGSFKKYTLSFVFNYS